MMDSVEKSAGRLLTTKLHIPAPPATIVARPELEERLHESMQRQLTLVCAPAGAGKTTLLSEWLALLEHRFTASVVKIAWLSLDREDNDPLRFWRYVTAALESACSELGERLLSALSRIRLDYNAQTATASTDLSPFLTTLCNTLSATASEFVLVLDDYHVIQTPAIHESMNFLLEHQSSNLHLILTTRSDPPFPLARLRTRQQLVELRATDLRFNLEDTTRFLRRALGDPGKQLSVHDVAALEERTEGWIAGLQLAALSMRGRENLSGFIASFTGSHRYIVDYLVEEVLYRLPEQVQTFLLATSLLERLCAPLCDAVTLQDGSQDMLELLERENIFLVPLDDERHWYRYHHLFAEVLAHRLQRLHPDLVPELHRRASAWYEQNDDMAAAVEHALSGRDLERAASLIEQAAGGLLERGEMSILRRWFEALPGEFIRSRITLRFQFIWVLFSFGRLDEVEVYLRDIEQALSEIEEEDEAEKLRTAMLAARAAYASATGDMTKAVALITQALERTPPHDLKKRCVSLQSLAMTYWIYGELEKARAVLRETLQVSRAAKQFHNLSHAIHLLAIIEMHEAHLHEAQKLCQEAISLAQEHALQDTLAAHPAYLGMAEVLYEWNRLEETESYITKAMLISRKSNSMHQRPFELALLAKLKVAQGDFASVRRVMQAIQQVVQENGSWYYASVMTAWQITLAVRLGDRAEAERWASQSRHHEQERISFIHENKFLALVRLSLLQKDYDQALTLLQRLRQAAEQDGRTGSLIGILALEALTYHVQGQTARALPILARALALAEPEGYIRTFIDEGEPMVTLLQTLLTLSQRSQLATASAIPPVSSSYLRQLLAAAGIQDAAAPEQNGQNGAGRSSSELLSERELEILRLIAAGLSNQEIMEQLVIARSTLKTHINHIYGKLDVRSRTQAVAQARALNLL
ncbi:MAG: AAA family ATPase [Ktedonobacteraceae bacterium]|nr:AAA family ATPase [Ktedonobacteraceae bacterium]